MKKLILTLAILMFVLTGCAQMMGQLRRDFDDSDPYYPPTVGGSWTEGGHLSDDPRYGNPYDAVGHSERSPASAGFRGRNGWVTPDHVGANRRDIARNLASEEEASDEESDVPSFSNTPSMAPPVKRLYKNGSRATRADFIDESTNEGSLWASDGQTNYYFTKNKIRGVGDIVTVNIEEALLKDTVAEVRRTLSPREKEKELMLAQDRLRAKALGLDTGDGKDKKDSISTSSAAPARSTAGAKTKDGKPVDESMIDIPQATMNDIDVAKSLELKAGDTMMSEIVERYPNGNYKIRGTKRVRYGSGTRLITLVGVVKGADISEDDFVNSGKLYEYRLESLR